MLQPRDTDKEATSISDRPVKNFLICLAHFSYYRYPREWREFIVNRVEPRVDFQSLSASQSAETVNKLNVLSGPDSSNATTTRRSPSWRGQAMLTDIAFSVVKCSENSKGNVTNEELFDSWYLACLRVGEDLCAIFAYPRTTEELENDRRHRSSTISSWR
jgi:hypothetical protein